MANLINEAKRMQQLAGINEGIASTDHIEVGEEYSYASGIQGKPPVKIKVVKILKAGSQYFIGEVLKENETTEYKGWKKGDTFQLNTANIIEKSGKQLSALNPIVEPKNDVGNESPKITEIFNKVVAWAKENKMRTVAQTVNEFAANDMFIRLWGPAKDASIDIIVNVSKEKELMDFLKTLGGKIGKHHMDEETQGARFSVRIEEPTTESLDIDSIVNEALKSVRK